VNIFFFCFDNKKATTMQAPALITPQAMEAAARELITPGRVIPLCANSERKNWASFFGTLPVVAASLWNRIKYLSFHSLPMNAEDLASLGMALVENQSLETLDLHGDVSQLKSDDLIAFASQLSLNHHLKCFDLSGFPVIPLDVDEEGKRFLKEMRNNVTLKN
jgi:hypothetical protein